VAEAKCDVPGNLTPINPSFERKSLMSAETGVRNVTIIGSGPAGLTAAVYTARANLAPLVIEGEPSSTSDQPGGQLMLTTEVENFPGFPEGIMGPELMSRFRDQALRFGAEIITEKVSRVDFSTRPFSLWIGDPDAAEPTYRSHAVIVATGARSLMLGLEAESRLLGHGLSTCATCDGFFFRDNDIAVVGGGDSALEEAIFLTKFARSVTIIHRRDQLRASKIMQDRAFANEKISFLWNHVVTDILGTDRVEGVRVRSVIDDTESTIPVTGLFVAIGHQPNTNLFKGQLEMDGAGYLITRPGSSYTNVEGVFACGDVQDHTYRQAITAAGSGCMAAIDAERWLEAQGIH
jgi:thioredoxin reductase (NADPH)